MKHATKNNTIEKIKEKIQIGLDWAYQKTNLLLGKVGASVDGVFALIILAIAGIAAIFITLGIVSFLIFIITFYIIFIAITSIIYKLFNKK